MFLIARSELKLLRENLKKLKWTFVCLFFIFWFVPTKSFANECQAYSRNKIQNMVAFVERINIKRNSLHVINEQTLNRNRFFVSKGHLRKLKEGDRVRIYYYCGNNALFSLKKMTPVVFNKSTSNKGYVYGNPKSLKRRKK